MTIKATKTSLYKLVTEHAAPPIMKKTKFTKLYRAPSYWLEWYRADVYFTAHLSACAGTPLLTIKAIEHNEKTGVYEIINQQKHILTVEDLRGRGMIDEQIKKQDGMTAKERAEVAAELAESGFCTNYPGYLCDRDWSKDPAVCPRCITSWIIRSGITQRDDSRIRINGGTAHG